MTNTEMLLNFNMVFLSVLEPCYMIAQKDVGLALESEDSNTPCRLA